MRALIVAGLLCITSPVLAVAQEAVTRTSPLTTMGTTRTSERFVACLLPVVQRDFPASSVTVAKGGWNRTIFVTGGAQPVTVAVVDIGDGQGGKSSITIRTEKPHGQPGLGIIKAARNCS